MARRKFSKEEKKQMRKEQRQKDALRSYRCRGFKNFLFWLTGVLTSVVLIISALFIGVAVVPVRVYLGNNADGVVSDDVSSKSLLNAIMKANTYDMADFPVVTDALYDLSENFKQYLEIDVEKVKTLKFDETFATELQSCIKVVATLESVGGTEMIGDIGKLEVFSDWTEVEDENLPSTDSEGNIAKDVTSGELLSNPKLYYYKKTDSLSLMSARTYSSEGEWVRAFDDNGNRVPESIGQTLYYANLSRVPVLDLVDLIDESLGRLKLTDLLINLGGADLGDTSLIGNILGDKTIAQIGEISAEGISLTSILPYNDGTTDNSGLYKIPLQVCGAQIDDWSDDAELQVAAESLNINSFSNLSFENLSLTTFLPYKDTENSVDNSELYKMLLQICGNDLTGLSDAEIEELAGNLNINSFSNLSIENLSLTTFLPYKDGEVDNSQIYKVLLQLCGNDLTDLSDAEIEALANELGIDDFSDLSFESISLSTLLPYEGNEDLYKILLQLCKIEFTDSNIEEKVNEITINSFNNISFESISLETFLPYEGNEDLYKVLLQLCKIEFTDSNIEEKVKDITVSSFNDISFENVSLATLLPYEGNEDLYKILLELCDIEFTDDNIEEKVKDITVSSFGDINFENVSLATLLPYEGNEELYKLLLKLCEIGFTDSNVEEKAGQLTINSFKNISFEDIGLTTFLAYEGNEETYKVLLKICYDGEIDWENPESIRTAAESLSMASFNNLSFEDVSLTTFLSYEDNEATYEMLLKMCYDGEIDWENPESVKTAAQSLSMDAFNNLSFEDVALTTVLPYDGNEETYKIFLQISNVEITDWDDAEELRNAADQLSINSVTGLNFDNISISFFDLDEDTVKILFDAVNAKIEEDNELLPDSEKKPLIENVNDLTVGHLTMLDIDYVSLSALMPYSANKDVYKIILQACGEDLTGLTDSQIEELANGLSIEAFTEFDFNKVTIASFDLPQQTIDLLLNAVNGKISADNQLLPDAEKKPLLVANQLTIGHLMSLDINYITLSSVLPYSENVDMYKIILQACGENLTGLTDSQIEELANDLSIDAFTGFEFNRITIASFDLPQQTMDLLLNAVNGKISADNQLLPDAEKKPLLVANQLTIEHLMSLDINYITLSSVLPYSENAEMYKIILQACGENLTGLDDSQIEELANDLSINAFSDINFNKVSITTLGLDGQVLDLVLHAINSKITAENKTLPELEKKPLLTAEQLTVEDLLSLDIYYIELSSVMPYEGNESTYKILLQASGRDLTGLDDSQIEELATTLTINAFNSIDFDNVSVINLGIEGQSLDLLLNAINNKIKADNELLPELEKKPLLTEEQLTVGHLLTLDTDYITLSSVLTYSGNEEMYKIILQACGKEINGLTDGEIEDLANDLSIGAFSELNFNRVSISTFGLEGQALNLLLDAVNGKITADNQTLPDSEKRPLLTANQLTISHLTSFDTTYIKLSTVLPYEDEEGNPINTELYNILLDVINGDSGTKTAEDIAVDDLATFNTNNIKLVTVMPKTTDNQGLYNILLDVVNKNKKEGDVGYVTYDKITISNLSTFNFNDVKLSTVLPYEDEEGEPTNTALYSILLDVVNGDSGTKTEQDLKLSDLTGFSYDDLHLSTILDPAKNSSLYDVLCDVLGVSAQDIKVSDLEEFNVADIHLKTVLGSGSSGNVILDKLIEQDIAINELATSINNLKLYDIYGQNCFVEYKGETGVARYSYNESEKSYELDANGEYVISKKAGIWLFMCFDYGEEIQNTNPLANNYGCRLKYSVSNTTLNTLSESNSGESISYKITHATIRQLVESGILESAHPGAYAMTLQNLASGNIGDIGG